MTCIFNDRYLLSNLSNDTMFSRGYRLQSVLVKEDRPADLNTISGLQYSHQSK